ncbi:MAG: hypothetical protein WBF89_05365 [Steroidobacteraceae bacterium]|jgi:hypothetical protein
MNAQEAMRLCESLSDTVDLGPGVQNEVFALPEARASIQRLREAIAASDIRRRLLDIENSFGKWFTERDWRGHDQGRSFQRDLFAELHKLKTSIQLWYSAQSVLHS